MVHLSLGELRCILALCTGATLQAASAVGATAVPSAQHREGGQKMGVITVTASLTVTEPLTQPDGAPRHSGLCASNRDPSCTLGKQTNKSHIHVRTNNNRKLVLRMKMLGGWGRTPGRNQLQCDGIKQTHVMRKNSISYVSKSSDPYSLAD